MPGQWTKSDFEVWMSRNGLDVNDVVRILNEHTLTSEISYTEINSILHGDEPIREEYTAIAKKFETSRFVSDEIDSTATFVELSDKCDVVPRGVITGLSAGVMRGWTSATTYVYYVATTPSEVGKEYPKDIIAVPCENLTERVQVRKDAEGNWYRLADPVRMVVDAARLEYDEFSVEELVREALAEGISRDELYQFAHKQGEKAVEKLGFYLSRIDG